MLFFLTAKGAINLPESKPFFQCSECAKKFGHDTARDDHEREHKVRTVKESPLVLSISLPDGCTPGRHEAAVYFAEAVAESRERFPHRNWQFVTFDHEESERFGGVNAWLAVAS